MKKKIAKLFSLVTASLMMLGSFSFAADEYGAAATSNKDTFTLKEMLTYAIQDEYLAREEYNVIMDKFGVQTPFVNIEKAENVHVALLEPLFDKYSIELPKDEAAKYVAAPATLKDAFQAGVTAEIANIGMYEKFLNQNNLPDDVKIVFERLKSASENHLAAFQRGLSRVDNTGTSGNFTGKNSGFGKGYGNGFGFNSSGCTGRCLGTCQF